MPTDTLELEQELQNANLEPKREQPRASANWKRRFAFLAGALVLTAAVTGAWMHYRDRVSTDDAQVDGHIVPIASRISGTVAEVLVNDNQPVKAGQVLVRIDPRDYQAKVDQARAAVGVVESQAAGANVGVPLIRDTTTSSISAAAAQLAAAQADYTRAKVDYDRAASADLAYAKANVDARQADNDRATADLDRMKPLVGKTEISRQQYDGYVAAARVAESQLQAAQEKLKAAYQDAETKKAALAAAQARIEQAQAGLAQAQASQKQVNIQSASASSARAAVQQANANLETVALQLSYTVIVAPVDGVVTHKSVEVGQIIQPGQSLLTVVPLQDVWVTANFKETQLAGVRVGQRADIEVDEGGTSISGRVDSLAGATGARLSLLPPENATGNFVKVVQRIPVKIVFDKLPGGVVLRPGMNVDATIFTK